MPKLKAAKGIVYFMKNNYSTNINKSYLRSVSGSQNIDVYWILTNTMWSNDYCQWKFSNIQSRLIHIRETTLIQMWLTYGLKEYEIKCAIKM